MAKVDVTTCGAGSSNPAVNVAAIQKATNLAGPGGAVYFPAVSGGYPVFNGQLVFNAPNLTIMGDASMGVSVGSLTSTIVGVGSGDTFRVASPGCMVNGLAWMPNNVADQINGDAFLKITATQVTVDDVYMNSPNIGVSVQVPIGQQIGQSWIRNVLMEGVFKTAGVVINTGGGASKLDHVRMFASGTQPPYGIVVTSAGEFVMVGSCDIDNCGTCLAIVPGLDGIANTSVDAIVISDCFFDNGNGDQILVRPMGSSFVLTARFSNTWTSSINNGGGGWPGNGFTFDGSRAVPLGRPPILDVSLVNSGGQNFVQHCGLYANAVQALHVVNSTFGGNFNGIQTYACAGLLMANKCGNYVAPPLGQPFGGNKAYGILLEKSPLMYPLPNPSPFNCLDGNGLGKILILP